MEIDWSGCYHLSMKQSKTTRLGIITTFGVTLAFCAGLGLGILLGDKGEQIQDLPAYPVLPNPPTCPPCLIGDPNGDGVRKRDEILAKLANKIARLEAELGLVRALSQGYQAEAQGTAQDWPAEVPDGQRPENFQAWLAESLDACEVPAELLGYDCAEPPCIARLRVQRSDWLWKLIRDCPSWTTHYRRVPRLHRFMAPCGPEGSESIVLLSPHWKDYPGEVDQLDKRLQSRWIQAQESWTCGD